MELGEALKKLFISSGLVDVDRFHSQVTDAEIESVSSGDEEGFFVCTINYTANYSCERLPSSFDARYMAILVATFLSDNDSNRQDRDLENPEIQIDDIGGGVVSISISIDFSEDVYMYEDKNGPINFDGNKYSLGKKEVIPARRLTISAAVK